MATKVLMPRLSPTMEEGVIAEWLVKEGETVETSQLLCEIETDKASMEYESPDEGKIVKILVEPGKTIKVDTLIAIIAEDGEDLDIDDFIAKNQITGAATETKNEEKKESVETVAKSEAVPSENTNSSSDSRIKASPLAKSIAKESNIDLSAVKGSGPNGRIIAKDLENVSANPQTSSASSTRRVAQSSDAAYEDVKNSTMRNVIAKRLLESSQGAPEFFLTIEIDMKNAMAFRKQINSAYDDVKITFNDLVIKATAIALKKNPRCNGYWQGDSIRYFNDVHISVAVAIEDGLITPVIRNADQIGLSQISAEVKELAKRGKEKKLQPEEYTGGTFSVSNLGMFGIEQFTSILNPPESGIFAIGAIIEKAVVVDGQLAVGHTMKITMTCDHRVIDGATGSQLLKDVKLLLENPSILAL
jgi:pyruvate dehydrogenase E2 component (dihydrolipoamide acetyltransferase)